MSATSTNRDRASAFRANRHYFRRPSSLGAWKVRLAIAAVLVSVGWVVGAWIIVPGQMKHDVSRGPVASVHAAWNDRCEACHAPSGAPDGGPGGIFDCAERWRAFRCDTCHSGPTGDEKNYAAHHATAIWPKDKGNACAACHHDHQGGNFSLVKIADADCLQCHKNLKDYHSDPGKGTYANAIARFEEGTDAHPAFKPVSEKHERTLKFSHSLHLNPGIVQSQEALAKPEAVMSLDKLPAEYRERYKAYATGENGSIRLDCAACHDLDAGGGPRSEGAYYQPIKFEKHCQACHQLELTAVQSKNGVATKGFIVPHGLSSTEMERTIRAEISRLIEAKNEIFPKVAIPPSDRLDKPVAIAVPSNLRKETDSVVELYQRLLYGEPPVENPQKVLTTLPAGHGCVKCHDRGITPANQSPELVATRIPSIWFQHARFNHASHRAVDCASCHDKKAEYSTGRLNDRESVGLPNIDNCRQCHGPAKWKDGKPTGGIRHGCVDCHTFHNGDRPTHGRGSPFRDPPANRRLGIQELLGGKK